MKLADSTVVCGVTDHGGSYKSDRPDSQIKQDVKGVIKNDIRVYDGLSNVKVNDGTVKLSGTVGSAYEKRRAKLNSWVAGVTAVEVDRLAVNPSLNYDKLREIKYVERSDKAIKEAVKDAFFYDPRVYSFNPEVLVEEGEVTLKGTVDNLKAKVVAEDDAENVVGVARVINRLKVRPKSMAQNDVLENKVSEAIAQDPFLERFDINAKATNGKVFLSGIVDNRYEKKRASEVTSRVKGVVTIQNNLTVGNQQALNAPPLYDPWSSGYNPSYDVASNDKEIKKNIQSQLWWSPFVNRDQIKVKVNNGVATLKGQVSSLSEKKKAAENAIEGGAVAVKNEIILE